MLYIVTRFGITSYVHSLLSLICIHFTGSYMAFMDANFILNPITDYAHLAGRGLMRHILPAGNADFLITLFSICKVL